MAGGKRGTKRAASPFIEKEAEGEGDDSGDEVPPVTPTVDLTSFQDDSPDVDCSAKTHRALDASRRKKARKSETATNLKAEEDEEEEEEEEDAATMRRRELLKKLREAKEETKAIQNGNFVCRRVRCPLCHVQMSESTSEEGETYLWCSNKCNLPYKPNNEKARYLGELSARINAKFVNPNRPPDCRHGDTAALTHLNGPKVKEQLRDTLFFICPRKVAEGRCDFVIAAEEEDELVAEYLETIYKNRNEKISKYAEENRKANENSFELGMQAALKAKEKRRLTKKE